MCGGVMRGEVLGVERRRRWDDEVKLAIVSAVGIDGATVTQVAQRHDVTRQQIYAWRHELKRKGLWSPEAGALFLPAGMVPAMELTVVEDRIPASTPVVWVELRLANRRKQSSGFRSSHSRRNIRLRPLSSMPSSSSFSLRFFAAAVVSRMRFIASFLCCSDCFSSRASSTTI